VVVANEMQETMNEQERDFLEEAPSKRLRVGSKLGSHSRAMLAACDEPLSVLDAYHDVSEGDDVRVDLVGLEQGKGEHVRSRVFPSPAAIDLTNVIVVGQDDGQLGTMKIQGAVERLEILL
jgi:hypothetical protein